ncbi:MAG: hypothetical protein QW695_04555, partial [Candidatus Bathyarchaeia archaeon]
MQITFYPIDIDYRESPSLSVRLWGIDRDGKRIMAFDDRFKQYFFVIPKEGCSTKLFEELNLLGVSVDEIEKRFFGKPIRVLKVESSNVKLINEALAKISRSRY